MSRKPAATSRGIVVTTERELEATFENLSAGDTVFISPENAPYRTTRWLDVDVDDVTITGPGIRTLIEPAPGADVGGIRIGHDRSCRGVTVRGVGYHGNADEQSNGVRRLHGIAVRDASNVALERNQIRGTHPRRHGDGGSGISVTRRCSDVRIANNRVHAFGDRGIQVAGRQIEVFGNVVTNGLDRPIACDVWYPDRQNRTARSVSVFGNLVGNSLEGSLVGVGRNAPAEGQHGYVSVFGNVGFGSHKSFCHLRGPAPLRNVSVQNNVGFQETDGLATEATRKFSGVAVDVDEGRNVAIRNNELYGYSGHGVHVESAMTGLSVQHNTITEPSLAGVHVAGGADGLVAGNLIADPGAAGVRVRDAAATVQGNYVRAAGLGIVAEGTQAGTGTEVVGNSVTTGDRPAPGILVGGSGVGVRGNTIRHRGGPAIAEREGATNNVYVDNRADGERPWQIRSPTSTVRNHTPAVGVHRDVTTGPESTVAVVAFDRPYARPPRVSFGRTGGGIEGRRFETDADGNYVGLRITTRRPGTTLDVFVSDE